jgi:tRNA U34 5-carboxymethylaminomethyl modifying GTPase MnmE/TrmE
LDLRENRYVWLTPPGSAAISVLSLAGPGLHTFFAPADPPTNTPRRVLLQGPDGLIDEAMACLEDGRVILSCHGGPAVREAVTRALAAAGFAAADDAPFGRTRFERETLALLPQAHGPAAVALALQAAAGLEALRDAVAEPAGIPALLAESVGCEYLFRRPRVQLWGPVNAGKSSLLNALCGRPLAATGPEPGLTRDVIEGLLEHRGFELQVFDAPGQWSGGGALDAQAQELAQQWRAQADLVLALVPPGGAMPVAAPGQWVLQSRADESGADGVSMKLPETLAVLKDRLVAHFFGALAALPAQRRFALHPGLRADLAAGRGGEWL